MRITKEVVAEEPRLLGCGVGNQRLLFGEGEGEMPAQPLLDPPLDVLGFVLGSGQAKQIPVGGGAYQPFLTGA